MGPSARAWQELLALLCSVWLWVGAAQRTGPTPTAQSQGPKLKFRLAGYPRKHNEGRIEVFYNEEWGTICDDDFTLANAHVLCRHLGFVAATGWAHSAKYGKGVGRVWLDNVNCGGSEKSIADCKSRGWGNSDCSHEEDAGVICKDERILGYVDSNVIEAEQNQVEELRLRPVVSGARKWLPVTEGVVEVRYKEGWAQICDEGWNHKNSRVVCGMMGFPAEKKINRNFYKLYLERQQLSYRLHSVACTGNEVHISMCPFEFYKGNATATCKGGMPAVVSCMPGPLFTTGSAPKKKQQRQQRQQGQQRVRLKGGAKAGEGRVEVLKNSEWGTVCDDRWNLLTASVVCRELGFGSAKEALTGARMGQGMGPIHMNEVQCTGSEKSLWSCPYKNITAEDCKHSEDAGLRCNIPYMGYETTIRLSGGRSRFEGRVEVALGTGSSGRPAWGLICGDGWGTLEAMVACRQLGLGFANHGLQVGVSAGLANRVRQGPVPRGGEGSMLGSQGRLAVGRGCMLTAHRASSQIRIVGGRAPTEGRVEVKRGSKWGTVCSEGWTTKEAMVACRQLGLGYSLHAVTVCAGGAQASGRGGQGFTHRDWLRACSQGPGSAGRDAWGLGLWELLPSSREGTHRSRRGWGGGMARARHPQVWGGRGHARGSVPGLPCRGAGGTRDSDQPGVSPRRRGTGMPAT
uniref:Lysyl oxidase like 3 n=1 Tax=Terrapene triunguis TaxID=2587831 RepID=A0A674KAW2_9SAUR